jgi:hypothetical protein
MPFIPHTPDDIARMLEPEGEDHGALAVTVPSRL